MNSPPPTAWSPDRGGVAWRRRPRRRLALDLEDDPVALLVNFFDCALVFAMGFMVALLASGGAPEDGAAASRPGADARVALPKRVRKLDRYRETAEELGGEGERLGTAYRLASGEVVYVPESGVTERHGPGRDER